MKRNLLLLIGFVFSFMLLSGCGGTGELTVSDPWARPAQAGGVGATYFVIENDSGMDDVLLSASTTVAEGVEIHDVMMMSVDEINSDAEMHTDEDHAEHMTDPDHEHDETHEDGMEHTHSDEDMASMGEGDMIMQMVRQENVPVANRETITFEPGSYHVMMIGLTQDLVEGDTITVTLVFENAGEIVLTVPVEQR